MRNRATRCFLCQAGEVRHEGHMLQLGDTSLNMPDNGVQFDSRCMHSGKKVSHFKHVEVDDKGKKMVNV